MVGWRIALWALIVVIGLSFLYLVRGILLPFVVSFILAALLEPSVRRLRLRGVSRAGAIAIVLGIFALFGSAFLIWLTPQVFNQVGALSNKIETLTAQISQADQQSNYFLRWNPVVQAEKESQEGRLDRILAPYKGTLDRLGLPTTQSEIMEKYVEPQRGQIAQSVKLAFASFFGILANLASQALYVLIIPILVFLILMDMESFKKRFPRWVPPSIRERTMSLIADVGDVFVNYLRGMSKLVLAFMVVATVVLSILQVPYAVLFGILAGCMYLIPYIGNWITTILLILVTGVSGTTGNFLFHLGSPWAYAFVAGLSLIVVGLSFDNLVVPKLVGGAVGLNPVVSIFVSFCGGALFGLPGMIVAFPVAGSIKVILDRLLNVTMAPPDDLELPSVPLRHRSVPSS
jgi:predicted PurR-regulated permease PerM